jgi:plasmid maintenance system antidote protein VapI
VGRPSGSGLPEEQRLALSRVLRVKKREFRSVSAMAEAWNMDQSYLNQLVNGTAGAGMSVLLQLREKSGLSLDTLMGLELVAAHLVRDEKMRIEVAGEPPTDELAADLERLEPPRVQMPATKSAKAGRLRPKPRTV